MRLHLAPSTQPLIAAMKLILLGTSGYHPSDRRQTPCLAIPACGVVLDAGTGMYRLGRYLKTDEVDIFLTHAHLDHVIGLTYLFSVMWEHPLRRVTVHGLPEKLDAVEKHLFFPNCRCVRVSRQNPWPLRRCWPMAGG